jgi:lipoprotein-anchoring transpeptidase ErfK/SrfK
MIKRPRRPAEVKIMTTLAISLHRQVLFGAVAIVSIATAGSVVSPASGAVVNAATPTTTLASATAAAPTTMPASNTAITPGAVLPPNAALNPVLVDGVPTLTYVASAKARKTNVYATKAATTPTVVLDNRTNFSGRHVFQVMSREGDWLNVRVPTRPNGRTGWIRLADVNLFQHDYGIVISLSQHSLVLYKAGKEVQRETVAVGQKKYPTPLGSYFIRELARPGNPRGAYGPWAFGLSAYSNVLTRFGRGDGQIGIHGTNLPKQLGTDASHGCIRVSNTGITKMAQTLPQGVPVEIRA